MRWYRCIGAGDRTASQTGERKRVDRRLKIGAESSGSEGKVKAGKVGPETTEFRRTTLLPLVGTADLL